MTVTGKALYEKTSVKLIDSSCAGATVTITEPITGQTYTGYTDNHGNFVIYNIYSPFVTPGIYKLNVQVTDYTLEGNKVITFEF